jgi:hypothetical protein
VVDPDSDQKPLVWPVPLILGEAVACVGVPWMRLHAVAAIYQGLGVGFTLLGLAAIGDRVRRLIETNRVAFAKTRWGASVWLARRREQLTIAWARARHKPRRAIIHAASASARSSASATLTTGIHRNRVDRDTISDRDWLAHLDDRLASVFELLDAAEKGRHEERQEIYRRIGVQRDELRAEIRRETRNGWQLVAWGLGYSLIGVALGAIA